MSFEEANPFRKLDKKQFKDAENPDGKSAGAQKGAQSSGSPAGPREPTVWGWRKGRSRKRGWRISCVP